MSAESPEHQYELVDLDLLSAIDEVVQGLEGQSRARHVNIIVNELQGMPNVVANPRAIDQVLINLIDNAIKYTPEHGRIVIDAHETERHVVFEVTNTGGGIPKNQLTRILSAFTA